MTAVPPRPAAPDACTCGHDGLPANFHMTPCPIKVAHFARLAAHDATAGGGLRSALAERDLLQRQLVHMAAERDGLTRELRDVLAAAARDAELREAVTSLAVRFETLSESLFSAASINAYDAAAECLRRALDVP